MIFSDIYRNHFDVVCAKVNDVISYDCRALINENS